MTTKPRTPKIPRIGLSVRECATLFGISSETVYSMLRAGELRAIQGIRPARIDVSSVAAHTGLPADRITSALAPSLPEATR